MPLLPFPTRSTVALVAVGDPGRDRTVYATIVLLVALGIAMILMAVWLLRSTRPDPEVLAPLERMGQRRWRRADPVWQRRHLDEVRPGGADPLEPTSAPPATDADFERGPQPIGFDDLVVSGAPSIADAAGLPAPSAEAEAVDGPLDADHGDEETLDGDDVTANVPEDDEVDGAASAGGDGGPVEDGQVGEVGSADDDDDVTGEQDTDDFLAVLDRVRELEPDVDRVFEHEPGVDPEDEDDPDVQSDGVPEAEPTVAHQAESEIDDEDDDAPG